MNESSSGLSAIAGSTAHALNNVLNMLYAAGLYLEQAGDEKNTNRARAAVSEAQGSIAGLSAAFSLLAMGEADVMAAEASPQECTLDEYDLEHLAEVLESAGKVRFEPPGSGSLRCRVGRDVLESVLCCAAVILRRTAPPDATLICKMSGSCEPSGACFAAMSLELTLPDGAQPVLSRSANHPCADALSHALPYLERLGVIVSVSPVSISVLMQAPTA